MVQVLDLVGYCDELLDSAVFRDYAPNGLQVEGTRAVRRLGSAVTATRRVLEQAAAAEVDALLVHHGYFWKGEPAAVVGMKADRLRRLLTADMSLIAYHLPLDAHRDYGNNACLGERLGLRVDAVHAVGDTPGLLWEGGLTAAEPATALAQRIARVTGRPPMHVGDGPAEVERVMWCTGAAEGLLARAAEHGADAYISGEISERTTHEARELGIHYFAAGHHATERYGVQALGEHLATAFAVEHVYFEDDNPV